MKAIKLAALAALAVAVVPVAGAQTQSCKRYPRMADGGDVQIRHAADDSMWYAASSANRIVKVDPKHVETPFVPVDGSTNGLSGLELDGKGNVWFSKNKPGIVGKFPVAGGEGVEYALPAQHSFPEGLLLGPDGAMWYRDPVQKNIGRVTADGSVMIIPAPPKTNPFAPAAMAFGPDHSLWITDLGANAIWKLDIKSQNYKRYDIPEPTAHPMSIGVAKDGVVWFGMRAIRKIGRLQNGAFSSIALGNESPRGLHVAEDQSIWFTTDHGFLHRIKPDGSREKYKCDNVSGPLTTSADGTVWALASGSMMVLKPGDVTSAPQVVSTSNVQAPTMMPLGPSPVREVTLAQLRKLFDDKTPRLIVHYTVVPKKGCGPCDESLAVFEEFARKNSGKAVFVRLANEYTEAAWSDPWYAANVRLSGVPTYITYQDQKEVARVGGRESVPVLEARLLPAR